MIRLLIISCFLIGYAKQSSAQKIVVVHYRIDSLIIGRNPQVPKNVHLFQLFVDDGKTKFALDSLIDGTYAIRVYRRDSLITMLVPKVTFYYVLTAVQEKFPEKPYSIFLPL